MQLLDIGYFKIYKHYHSKAINEIMQIKIIKFSKL